MKILTAPLPGLYLAVLAAALAYALRRWWDPVPARIWAVFGTLLLILFGPALFLGKVLLPVDILPGVVPVEKVDTPPAGNRLQLDLVSQIVPWQAQVRRAVRAGEWPLWNDLSGAGMPLLADPQSQVLEPLVLVALPLSLPQAVAVTAGLRVLLALAFFFLLLRRQGLSEGAALFGSVSFGLGGFLMLWLNWPIGNSPALFPLILYALAMTAERGARRDFLLLTLAIAALLAGGHPETILYVAVVGGLFALSRSFRLLRPAPERGGLLGRWALAGGIAFGLVAPVLVPAARFLPQTHRSHVVEMRNERLEELPALQGLNTPGERRRTLLGTEKRLVPVFAPNAFGNSRWGRYWGEANTNEDASGFAGSAALLAGLLAFFPTPRRFPQERLFLGLGVASFLISVRVPGMPQVMAAVPVLNQSISANRRLLLVLAFSLAYLAACTLERWRRGDRPNRRGIVGIAAVLLGLIAWGYLLSPNVASLLGPRRFWMGLQLAVVTASAALLLLGRRARTVGLLCGLAVCELLVFHRPANPSLPRSGFYPTTPSLKFLQENAGGSRVAGLGDRLRPNAATVYGLADIRISNPVKPFSYVLAVGPVTGSVRSTEHVLVKPEHPLYQLLGVRYVIALPKTKSMPGWRAVFRDPTARVFERTRVLPRLFLPDATEAGTRSWRRFLAVNPDFAARTLVYATPDHSGSWTAARPGESAVEILGMERARGSARVLLAEERLLASSVYQDGGWTLLLDGRPHPTVLSNGPFLAAWLPPGEHRVELVYRAPGLMLGLALAAVATAGLVAWVAAPTATRPLRPGPSAGCPAPGHRAPGSPRGRG